MVSKQNLQQRRWLILLADTWKNHAQDSRPRGHRTFHLVRCVWVQSACYIRGSYTTSVYPSSLAQGSVAMAMRRMYEQCTRPSTSLGLGMRLIPCALALYPDQNFELENVYHLYTHYIALCAYKQKAHCLQLIDMVNKNTVFVMLVDLAELFKACWSQFSTDFDNFVILISRSDAQIWRFTSGQQMTDKTDRFTPCLAYARG